VVALAEMASDHDILVADRFVASAHALHINMSTLLAERLRQLPLPVPDVTFYLDVNESVRRMRLRNRGRALDRFEALLATNDTFRARVAARMRADPHTHVIDTNDRPPELVAHTARDIWDRTCGPTG
jgi:thymidylate kinase